MTTISMTALSEAERNTLCLTLPGLLGRASAVRKTPIGTAVHALSAASQAGATSADCGTLSARDRGALVRTLASFAHSCTGLQQQALDRLADDIASTGATE